MYAIVDIETTGGHASANGITEIAIVLHDGKKITRNFQTLINPGVPIPSYITALTGIGDEMVQDAPSFKEVAPQIFRLLKNRVFVAHNVNFDYSFVKYQMALAGFDLQCKKLCTVRVARKLFPGFSSYGLGKLCKNLNIVIENRHRAEGDAFATARLFSLFVEKDVSGFIGQALSHGSAEQRLPPNLNKEDLDRLPSAPGVYYFNDQKGKVIYVGKAIDLKKRVLQHFSGNNSGRQRQEFLRHIHSITFQQCGSELMALILEASEINRLWPANNRALKRFGLSYGIYTYEDQKGYLRLVIDKKKRHSTPIFGFNLMAEGHNIIQHLMKEYKLCPKLCFIQRNNEPCNGILHDHCLGACNGEEEHYHYNERVKNALSGLRSALPSFAYFDEGRTEEEASVVLMESGELKGMGYVPKGFDVSDPDWKTHLQPYPSNDYIRNLVQSFADRYPEKVRAFPFES